MGSVVETLKAVLPTLRVTFRHSARDTGAAGYSITNSTRDLGYRPEVCLEDLGFTLGEERGPF